MIQIKEKRRYALSKHFSLGKLLFMEKLPLMQAQYFEALVKLDKQEMDFSERHDSGKSAVV